MNRIQEVHDGVYLVGSPNLTAAEDCCVYLVDLGDLILIDAAAGKSVPAILENVESLGFRADSISAVVATHCHFDHIGGIPALKKKTKCQIIAHELDAGPMEKGHRVRTAADWYNASFPPTGVDYKLNEDRDGKRVLFGQDIHGPFEESFGSDLTAWRKSMEILLGLKADILCEGHFG